MDESEHDVLAYMAFPNQHRVKLHSTNPLERLNKEVKRRADVVGIFPDEKSKLFPQCCRMGVGSPASPGPDPDVVPPSGGGAIPGMRNTTSTWS